MLFPDPWLPEGGGGIWPPIVPLNHIASLNHGQNFKYMFCSSWNYGPIFNLYLVLHGQERTLKRLICIFIILKFGRLRLLRKKGILKCPLCTQFHSKNLFLAWMTKVYASVVGYLKSIFLCTWMLSAEVVSNSYSYHYGLVFYSNNPAFHFP